MGWHSVLAQAGLNTRLRVEQEVPRSQARWPRLRTPAGSLRAFISQEGRLWSGQLYPHLPSKGMKDDTTLNVLVFI